MIVKPNGDFETISTHPSDNWYADHPEYIVVPDGTELAKKIIANYPYLDYVKSIDGKKITDVVLKEKPPEPVVVDPLQAIMEKLDKLEKDVADLKATKVKG